MQIVIDIDAERFKDILRISTVQLKGRTPTLEQVIAKGIPLPKGHGRLIDADEFEELFGEECVGDCGACMTKRKTDGRGRWYDTCSLIDISPTIIEADKAGEEEWEKTNLH